jgi:hypothetical protein
MNILAIISELQRRLSDLERDTRVVRSRGSGGGGFSGVVEFGDGTRVEGLNTYPDRPYLQINLATQTAAEIVGPPPYPRLYDGVIYREKTSLVGVCYIDRAG